MKNIGLFDSLRNKLLLKNNHTSKKKKGISIKGLLVLALTLFLAASCLLLGKQVAFADGPKYTGNTTNAVVTENLGGTNKIWESPAYNQPGEYVFNINQEQISTEAYEFSQTTNEYYAKATMIADIKINFSDNLLTAINNGRVSVELSWNGKWGAYASSESSANTERNLSNLKYSASKGITMNEKTVRQTAGPSQITWTDINESILNGTVEKNSNHIQFQIKAYSQSYTLMTENLRRYCYSKAGLSIGSIAVKITYTKPTASYSSSNVLMGTVSNAGGAFGFAETLSSIATPNEDHYFSGWTGTENSSYLEMNSKNSYEYLSSINPSYTANFAKMPALSFSTNTYNGTGLATEVVAGMPTGFATDTLAYRKLGSLDAFTSTLPTEIGLYDIQLQIKNSNTEETVGTKVYL